MSTNLPESLIIEILSWLPVNSLLQFKYVSKSWYKIIKSPYFISMHLKHNYGRRSTNCFIAQYVVMTQVGDKLKPYLVWHGESDQGNIIHDFISTLESSSYSDYDICGPCYGIYYLWDHSSVKWDDCCDQPRCLWNPALKEIKKLPSMIMKPNISSNMEYYDEFIGFGFDPVTVDYKVVAIKGYMTPSTLNGYGGCYSFDYPLSIMIYSLRTDSWKYLGDLSKRYYIHDNSCHAFVNRCFYWLGSNDEKLEPTNNDVIISIDLATEECQEIRLPDNICFDDEMTYDPYSGCLMVYNGSIALVALYYGEFTFDIWTLKGTTWSKELTMKLDCQIWKPLGHYNVDNNLVLFDRPDCLILCDPNTKETWKFNEREGIGCRTVSAYMESLVPLNDRDFWERKDEDQENRTKCKRRRLNNTRIFQ